jgi:phosphatidylserine decarboxylase precursor
MTTSSLLSRSDLSSIFLTSAQVRVDSLVGSFAEQATDLRSLAAMTAGGMAYRLGRIGAAGSQFLSVGVGLASEVAAFEVTRRGLLSLDHSRPELWRWSGREGLAQGLTHSLISFGTLRGVGTLTGGQNLIAQHLSQDLGMVAGHHLAAWAGVGERPQGSLIDQVVEAEAVNLQMQAGMGLMHGLTGGRLQGLERQMDREVALRPSSEPVSLPEKTAYTMNSRIFDPRVFLAIPKVAAGLALGWALSSMRRGPAVGTFLGLGALLVTKNLALNGEWFHWAGDGTFLGIAGLYGWLRARSLRNEVGKNPFQSEPDMHFPRAEPIPPGLVGREPVNLKTKDTRMKVLHAPVEADGFPSSFIWSMDPKSGLSRRQKVFYRIFDPVRFSLSLGRLSRSSLSRLIIPSFAHRFKIELSTFVPPAGSDHYKNFDQFFTRRFKQVTPFYPGAAPCEGVVVYMARGPLEQALNIKGEALSLRELLGPAAARAFQSVQKVGVIITYLSPRDYHLGHSPVEGKVVSLRRFPGSAWTVMPQIWNEPMIEGRPGTHYLNFNARDVVLKETPLGPLATVYVAATNVFSTEIHPKIGDTVRAGMHEQSYHFGSTNVYVFDASQFYFPQKLYPGKQLYFGQSPFLVPRPEGERVAPRSMAPQKRFSIGPTSVRPAKVGGGTKENK